MEENIGEKRICKKALLRIEKEQRDVREQTVISIKRFSPISRRQLAFHQGKS